MTSFTTETGELVRIGVDKLAAKLPEEERLRLAKALIVAAYEIAPKDRAQYRSDDPGPLSLRADEFPVRCRKSFFAY
jgi:hypothetical protein